MTSYTDWMLTIPLSGAAGEGMRHELSDVLAALKSRFTAYIGQPEKGESGYRHLQIFAQGSRRDFDTCRSVLAKAGLPDAHIEPRRGKVAECIGYVTKTATRDGDIVQHGEIDMRDGLSSGKGQGHRSDLDTWQQRIADGATPADIIAADGVHAARYERALASYYAAAHRGDRVRPTDIDAYYVQAGTLRALSVLPEIFGPDLFCAVDTAHPYDDYAGESVLALISPDISRVSIGDLEALCSGYGGHLPARFQSRLARYRTVLITSPDPYADFMPYGRDHARLSAVLTAALVLSDDGRLRLGERLGRPGDGVYPGWVDAALTADEIVL